MEKTKLYPLSKKELTPEILRVAKKTLRIPIQKLHNIGGERIDNFEAEFPPNRNC